MKRDILHAGRIGAPHGLLGEVKVQPWTDDVTRFSQLKDCLVVSSDEKHRTPAVVEGVRYINNNQVLLKLRGCDDRNEAEKLKGSYISVLREQAVELPEDTWFICDLLGCEVHDNTHGLLGKLADIIQQSAHDVYVVRQSGMADLLIPVLKTIIKSVDIENGRIDVELPNGLYEIYRA